jgi:hypothetical protein
VPFVPSHKPCFSGRAFATRQPTRIPFWAQTCRSIAHAILKNVTPGYGNRLSIASGIGERMAYMKKMKIYVPGLLSLLLLFPLVLYKLSHRGIFDKEHVIDVAWYSPAIEDPYVQKFPLSKDYININLTGNALTDRVKIEYVKVLVHEMLTLFDTTRGVHIIFADTAKYESFIDILDYCNQQGGLAYAPYESNFWIFNRFKNEEQKKTMWVGSCMVMSPLKYPEEKNNLAWAFAYGMDNKFWPIGLLFILLVILNFKTRLGR